MAVNAQLKNMSDEIKVIDMRIFTDLRARGMINAMIGESVNNENLIYLTNNTNAINLLIENQIKIDNIISFGDLKMFLKNRKSRYLIISPLQRFRLDILLLRVFGKVKIGTFVHDLHYLSRREDLRKEFRGYASILKKYIYNFNILIADSLFVDSILVSRQIKKIFNRDSNRVHIKRIFISEINVESNCNKKFDYYLALNSRFYKGIWALNKVRFMQQDAKILIDKKYLDIIHEDLLRNNPELKIYSQDLESDTALQNAYKYSSATLYLSRHEGFGFVPYEAAFFGSTPITLNCTTYLEISKNILTKIPLENIISVPKLADLNNNICFLNLAKKHILVK